MAHAETFSGECLLHSISANDISGIGATVIRIIVAAVIAVVACRRRIASCSQLGLNSSVFSFVCFSIVLPDRPPDRPPARPTERPPAQPTGKARRGRKQSQ